MFEGLTLFVVENLKIEAILLCFLFDLVYLVDVIGKRDFEDLTRKAGC